MSKTSTLLINTYHWNLVTVRDKKNTSTDLISKHSYAASRWHLVRSKPDCGKSSRHRQDKHLGQSHHTLSEKTQIKSFWINGRHF